MSVEKVVCCSCCGETIDDDEELRVPDEWSIQFESDNVYCESCHDQDDWVVTIIATTESGCAKGFIGEVSAYVDELPFYGDFMRSLSVGYTQTDGWRGYYEATLKAPERGNWLWMGGWMPTLRDSSYPGKMSFAEIVNSLMHEEHEELIRAYLVVCRTSNVCSCAYDLYVYKQDLDAFTRWLQSRHNITLEDFIELDA